MSIIVSALKSHLGAFGWHEVLRRDGRAAARADDGGAQQGGGGGGFSVPFMEVQDLDKYLATMGVANADARARLTHALPYPAAAARPYAELGAPSVVPAVAQRQPPVAPSTLIRPANRQAAALMHPPRPTPAQAAAAAARLAGAAGAAPPPEQQQPQPPAPLVVVLDSTRSALDVEPWARQAERPVFYLHPPPHWHLDLLPDVPALARLLHAAMSGVLGAQQQRQPGVLVAGVGVSCVVAHELAVQVRSTLLARSRESSDARGAGPTRRGGTENSTLLVPCVCPRRCALLAGAWRRWCCSSRPTCAPPGS